MGEGRKMILDQQAQDVELYNKDEFDDDGRPKRTATVWTASAHIITAVIGSGVLSLAWSMSQLGWIVGPAALFLFSIVTFYTSSLLTDYYRNPDPVYGKRNYTYMNAVQSNLGATKVWFCGICQYVILVGTAIGYTITASICVARLDRNSFTCLLPSSINNLTNVNKLNLANNKLSGPVPDLTGLYGSIPENMFSLPGLQQVILNNNLFNGTFTLGDSFSSQLQVVNFQNNSITSFTLTSAYNETLILADNPVCKNQLANTVYCRSQQPQPTSYSTSTIKCGSKACPLDQSLNPQSCDYAYPYVGELTFRAPFFRDLTNSSLFHQLEMYLWTKLELTPGLVILANPFFNSDNYLKLQVKLFPSSG